MLGAIEAGGTKFVCAVSPDGQKVEHREEFPTLSPEETMVTVYHYFEHHPVESIGIGSFGPVDIKRHHQLLVTLRRRRSNPGSILIF